jgi:hypothetical protein
LATVCVTVIAWYHGDAVYNDYQNHHRSLFEEKYLDLSWLQIGLFGISLAFLTPSMHKIINGKLLNRRSLISDFLAGNQGLKSLQPIISYSMKATLSIWALITCIGIARVQSEVGAVYFPYLAGYRVTPWGRGRLGSGFDAVLSLFQFLDMFCLASFGVIAAVSTQSATQRLAMGLMLLTWPNYLFDRTRNQMIAIALPCILAFVFIRLNSRTFLQIATIVISFLTIDLWFRYVLANRTETSMAAIFMQEEKSVAQKHLGLNMFEELTWVNSLTGTGQYEPNWGGRYFAEIVNFIPRSLWPEKPMVGIDYAVARGFSGGSEGTGVTTTIATGMIGQGVVNFGSWLGPFFAAFLMSIWVAVLARFDLNATTTWSLILYGMGIVLTFNMGRDITLLVLYPVLFGYLAIQFYSWIFPLVGTSFNRREASMKSKTYQ